MEGKKYRLIILMVSLSSLAFSQDDFHEKIYESFITNEMDSWKLVIDEMHKTNKSNPEMLKELINYEYGYIGWCIGNNQKKQAKDYLDSMEENLETLKSGSDSKSTYHAYMAAAYGFKIGLSAWRAPFLGPKSMEHAEKAIENDSLNFQANTELGNIWNHMPAVFGGSDEKALKYYQNAIAIYENSEEELKYKKWLYLNIVATSGKIEFERKNYSQALHFYKKALKIEPRFKWVMNELLPELKNAIN
jgi:tetratricopeptide (TPR) repeat protein